MSDLLNDLQGVGGTAIEASKVIEYSRPLGGQCISNQISHHARDLGLPTVCHPSIYAVHTTARNEDQASYNAGGEGA